MTAVIELPTRDQITALDAADRMRLLQELTGAERGLFAAFVDLLDVMDAEGDHVEDGHRSVRNLLVAQTNCDHASANAKVKAMKTLRLLPDVRQRLAAGEFGVAQVHSLAGAYGNPRVRDYLAVIEDRIIDWAALPHDEFDSRLVDFVRLADADGASSVTTPATRVAASTSPTAVMGSMGRSGVGTRRVWRSRRSSITSRRRSSMPIGPTPKPASVPV